MFKKILVGVLSCFMLVSYSWAKKIHIEYSQEAHEVKLFGNSVDIAHQGTDIQLIFDNLTYDTITHSSAKVGHQKPQVKTEKFKNHYKITIMKIDDHKVKVESLETRKERKSSLYYTFDIGDWDKMLDGQNVRLVVTKDNKELMEEYIQKQVDEMYGLGKKLQGFNISSSKLQNVQFRRAAFTIEGSFPNDLTGHYGTISFEIDLKVDIPHCTIL